MQTYPHYTKILYFIKPQMSRAFGKKIAPERFFINFTNCTGENRALFSTTCTQLWKIREIS